VLHEVLRDLDRVRQPQRRLLADVGGLHPEGRAVPERRADLVLGVPDDDSDIGDSRVADGLDAVKENRLVRDRNELLGARVRDGAEPRALAAAQDEGLHALLGITKWKLSRGIAGSSECRARPRT